MAERIQIGIFRDTHHYLDPCLPQDFSDCQEVWHAGDLGSISVLDPWRNNDKMLRAVYGNIDGMDVRGYFPEYQFFSIQNFPVLMLHIAGKHPSWSPLARKLIKQYKPKMLVCGHSHICRVVMEGGILYVNPGAAGRSGFHKVRTALKLTMEGGKPVEVRVLELGSRSEKATDEENSIPA